MGLTFHRSLLTPPACPPAFTFSPGPLPAVLSFPLPAQAPAPAPPKRIRPLADVDGEHSLLSRKKKRRLRLFLITSRLSLPFSNPATHIADRGSSKIAVWAKQRGARRFLLRKVALMNSILRRARSLQQAVPASQMDASQLEFVQLVWRYCSADARSQLLTETYSHADTRSKAKPARPQQPLYYASSSASALSAPAAPVSCAQNPGPLPEHYHPHHPFSSSSSSSSSPPSFSRDQQHHQQQHRQPNSLLPSSPLPVFLPTATTMRTQPPAAVQQLAGNQLSHWPQAQSHSHSHSHSPPVAASPNITHYHQAPLSQVSPPRRGFHYPHSPSPLGLSNYDALDTEDDLDEFQTDFDECEDDDAIPVAPSTQNPPSPPLLYSDFNLLDPDAEGGGGESQDVDFVEAFTGGIVMPTVRGMVVTDERTLQATRNR